MDDVEEPDPLLDEIHAIREKIWKDLGDDPRRIYEHYAELQAQFKGRLISRTFTPEEEARFQKGLEELRRMTPEEFERRVAEDEEAPSSETPAPVGGRQDRPAA